MAPYPSLRGRVEAEAALAQAAGGQSALVSLWVESHRHRELCQSPAVSPLPRVPDAREKGVTFERQELSESIDHLEGRHSASLDSCACHF